MGERNEAAVRPVIAWGEFCFSGMSFTDTGMYYIYGVPDVKQQINDMKSRVDVIQYNQAFGTHYSPWDMQEFNKAWDNQDKYIQEQREESAAQ